MNAASTSNPVASDPQTWADTVLQARFDRWAEHDTAPGHGEPEPGRWVGIAEVTANDEALLRDLHPRLMARYHAPADTAAMYLAGWYAGAIADVVGYGLATAGAGIVVRADDVRLHVHPDDWVDRIRLESLRAVVPDGHPWAGQPGVETAGGDEMLACCVSALVEVVTPIVDGCHRLARVGRVGLWNEVGDNLALAFDDAVAAHDEVRDLLLAAGAVPGVPWRATPSIEVVDDSELGPTLVRHKGGCCLAYQCSYDDRDDDELDPDLAAYRIRFGSDTAEPRYCTTCKFRDPADARERQLFWRRVEHRRHAHTSN